MDTKKHAESIDETGLHFWINQHQGTVNATEKEIAFAKESLVRIDAVAATDVDYANELRAKYEEIIENDEESVRYFSGQRDFYVEELEKRSQAA